MTVPPPRAYRGRRAESGEERGATDSGAVGWLQGKEAARVDGFALRGNAHIVFWTLASRCFSWVLAMGAMSLCRRPLLSLSLSKKKKKRHTSPPMCRLSHPIKSALSCLLTLPISRPALELEPGASPAVSVSAHAPQPRQKEKRMGIHHARGTSVIHPYVHTNTHTTHSPSHWLLPVVGCSADPVFHSRTYL